MEPMYRAARARRLPPWRSIHFVPANVDRFIGKAASLDADAIQVDLEDSVPEAEKAGARERLRETVSRARRGGADVLVRVNRPIGQAVRDIEAAVCGEVDAITLTKLDGPSHVRLLDELASDCEAREGLAAGHVRFVAVIETPEAYDRMAEIASASPRVVAMMLGSEDFALECGFEPADEVLLAPKQRMIIAARAAGVLPYGYIGTIANFRDTEAFRAMVRRSRHFGFEGGTSIHPSQIPVLNEEFAPSDAEVAHAARVVEADARARTAGRGSCEVDGRMVDVPVVRRAERLLARRAAIEAAAVRRQQGLPADCA
jgi:citrate lyase subunit beta/citryl-CoA lyase